MHPAIVAFRRARNVSRSTTGEGPRAAALAVIEVLLVLSLVVTGGLLPALLVTRGILRPTATDVSRPPAWLTARIPVRLTEVPAIEDTGLYPVVSANQAPPSPWHHRQAAKVLRVLVNRVRPLQGNLGALFLLLAKGLGLVLILAFVRQARRQASIAAAQSAAGALRNQMHRQIYRFGQTALPGEAGGPVLDLFDTAVDDVRDGLIADIDHRFIIPPLFVGLVLIALFISVPLTVFVVSLSGLALFVLRSIDSAARTEAEAAGRDAAVHMRLLLEDLGMLRTVRVYAVETLDQERFGEHAARHSGLERRRLKAQAAAPASAWLLTGAAGAVILGVTGWLVLNGGSRRLSVAAAVVLLGCLVGALPLAWRWLDVRVRIRRAGRSAVQIYEFLGRRTELQQAVGAQFLQPLRERISFENVTLENAAGKPLLQGLSAEIPAKTRTAILALDEAPKLAVACLIPRLIDPKVGRVKMDGLDLRDVTLESLRAQVATVLQSDLVFSDSVWGNIGLGDPSYAQPRIIEAAKVARAHNFIQDLPDGYDTVIGPLGHYLTRDQQYRIALARAYLHDPSILIIEEPDADLDDETKAIIDDAIERICKDRTVIFLPHRLSTIRKCDQVIVLHNGRVDIAGAPRELHGKSKLYRHIQYVEFNQFATGEVEAGQM